MTTAPVRTETGGPNRTPRSEITSIRKVGRKYEPAIAIDFSLSMDWSAQDEDNRSEEYPHPASRRAVLEGFLPMYIKALAKEDSEAEAEQADGSDDKGGVYGAGFGRRVVKMGDLNESNAQRKLEAAMREIERDKGREGTMVAPAVKALIDAFNGEFEDDDPETVRVHEVSILT